MNDRYFKFDFNLPKIEIPRLPEKTSNCEAAAICKYLGNLRNSCLAGSPLMTGGIDKCMASLVLLLGRIANITLTPPPPEKEFRGFSGQSPEAGGK